MSVQLNHHIVRVRDKEEAARFFAEILGLPPATRYGPFLELKTANDVSLDFADDHGEPVPAALRLPGQRSGVRRDLRPHQGARPGLLGRPVHRRPNDDQHQRRGPRRVLGRSEREHPGDHHPALRQRRLAARRKLRQRWRGDPDASVDLRYLRRAVPEADRHPAAAPSVRTNASTSAGTASSGRPWPRSPRGPRGGHAEPRKADLVGIGVEPSFAIGQRALLVRTPHGNVMWDCISLLDERARRTDRRPRRNRRDLPIAPAFLRRQRRVRRRL